MDNKEIGTRILAARKKLGYTQKQLGDLINVSDKAVSKWERGVGCPDISLLLPLTSNNRRLQYLIRIMLCT